MKFCALAFLSLAAPSSATYYTKPTDPVFPPTDPPPQDQTCQHYEIDFEGFPRGEYITDDLFADYGVTVSCKNNDSHNQHGCRIFDTAVPTGHWPGSSCNSCGDPDLGSPNKKCPGGGVGVGDGGKPNSSYPNCVPQGNVLVIDENGPSYPPDDSYEGGRIKFDFEHPVNTKEICFLDVDNTGKVLDTKIKVLFSDGRPTVTYPVPKFGNNGFGCIALQYSNVRKLDIIMGLGAVASLSYSSCNGNGGGGGDPHIDRWNQEPLSFHGECDLVMAHSDRFHNHAGFDLHIRTTIYEFYSYIEAAALRLGKYNLQVEQEGLTLDDKAHSYDSLPLTFGDDFQYTITLEEMDDEHTKIRVLLHEDAEIFFTYYKHFLHILISGNAKDFGDSVGLLGEFGTGALFGRDGGVIEDFEQFAHSWQVNPETDPLVFRELRAPQFPAEKCRMPTVEAPSRRNLRANTVLFNEAKEACAPKQGRRFDLCVEDVLATGDIGMATAF